MRVTVLAPGSLGNLVPYVALSLGLREAGMDPVVATHPEFEDLIVSRGLEFATIGGEGLFDEDTVKELQESGRNPIAWARRSAALLERFWDEMANDAMAACEGADAVVFNAQGHPGYHIAQRRGIPAFGALYLPVSSTREFPHPLVAPGAGSLGRIGNAITYRLGEQMIWRLMRKPVQRWRRETLGLEPLPAGGIIRVLEREHLPIVYGYSPAVVPRPRDWGDWLDVTGYWYLDPPEDWSPPADLEAFLGAGPPPVYVGFGSSPISDPEALFGLLREALGRVGARAIVAGDWATGVAAARDSDDVFLLPGFVPFDWLFRRVSAVVHHGGCGTTHEGLRAGRPSVLLPSYPDQFFFGRRVLALNAGPKPIRKEKLTADSLAGALRAALEDESIQRGAAAAGERMSRENGVERAVEFLSSRIPAPVG